ncbi:hypothetical protein [Wolbachia endosymbiont of Drosophila pseudotakahashii]|nr:hypothetical protein [Wolbachia endosymbiont of Drosophila pseudotakahashii]UZE38561.1 hypothetical protein ONI09_00060 [Wolbachia endosymbiont of Drosophila pseudotakahashii]
MLTSKLFWIPVSGHWDDRGEEATWMTPFFFLDPSSQGTGMTGEGTRMTP